jgi:hypothetical protein
LNESDRAIKDRFNGLGQIVVTVHRVVVLSPKSRLKKYQKDGDGEGDRVPEKALKGRALSRKIEYVKISSVLHSYKQYLDWEQLLFHPKGILHTMCNGSIPSISHSPDSHFDIDPWVS